MKKKELMKRLSALAMSAMMTVTMIPSNAFAADIGPISTFYHLTEQERFTDDN